MTLREHYQIERSEGREEGREEGRAEGRAQAVDAIMASMKLSLEEACKAVNITKDDYNRAKELIGEN